MLILTRKPTETILIGDKIRVTIMGVKGISISVGIEAPPDVRIDREEVRARIEAERETQA